ncbi:MAG: hypothetical protein ACRD1Y_00745 [Terriglobales bacterium]
MNVATIHECLAMSFADTPFPVVAARLREAGVARYHADLVRLVKIHYGDGRASCTEPLPLDAAPEVAPDFDAAAVRAALDAIQKGRIGYAGFLRRIMGAGCAGYEVYLRGRKVAYRGRDGDDLIERMPPAQD